VAASVNSDESIFDDPQENYFGAGGMAEEWWSTMSQRSPFFTYVKLYRAGKLLASPSLV
jgi:hypothetical protein